MINNNKTLPVHPYSTIALDSVILEAKANGSSTYNNPNDFLPELLISISKNGVIMVESEISLNHYLPFEQSARNNKLWGMNGPWDNNHNIEPLLINAKKSSLFELCCTEILHANFTVHDKISGLSHSACYVDKNGLFYIDGLNEFIDSFTALQERFDIKVQSPTLDNISFSQEPMDDNQFWDIIDKCLWKKDFDYNRIKSFLYENYDNSTLKQMDAKVRFKRGELYAISEASDLFGEADKNDRFSDCLNHIVGSGKQAFEKCINDVEFFAKFATSGAYKESFNYGLPSVRQCPYYPYAVDNGKSIKSEVQLRATAASLIAELNSIDFGSIYPKDMEKVLAQKEEGIYRAQQVLNGNYAAAYQDFNDQKYSQLSSIKGTLFHASLSNMLSDLMKKDGYHYLTTEWINGKPVNPPPIQKNQVKSLDGQYSLK